jgi:hypothetical protein
MYSIVLKGKIFILVVIVGLAVWMQNIMADTGVVLTNAQLRAESVFAEAEDFMLPKGWYVTNGHGIDMYSPAVSGGKTVGNPCEGTATLDVTIPKDGVYSMIVWFTKWVHDRSFELRVEQNGTLVASSTFNRPQDKQPNWSYNVQIGDQTALLKAGPAKLLLYGPPFGGYVGSPIDCVLLTQAPLTKQIGPGANLGRLVTPSGQPIDWHAFSPQCFVRFTMLTPDAPAVTADVSSSWHKDPWGSRAPSFGDSEGKPVPSGTPSAWNDISGALDTGESQATIWFTFKGDKPMPPIWRVKLEIASKPSPDAILKTLEDDWVTSATYGAVAGYVMPGNVPKYPDKIESIAAVTDKHVAFLKQVFPSLPGGDKDLRPKTISIEGDVGIRCPREFEKENKVLAMMGTNSVKLYGKDYQAAASAAGMNFSKAESQYFIHDCGLTNCSFDPALKERLKNALTAWVENMKKTDPVQFQNVRIVILADEPGTPNGLSHMVTCPYCQAAFRQWLQARGSKPQDFGFTSWDQVKPVIPDPKASEEMRKLGWLSSTFAQETTPLPYKYATEVLQKAFGRPVETRVNFSDESMNGYGTTMSNGIWGLNWFEFNRMNATTLPWTEDFRSWNPHITAFLVDVLRSTESTSHIPLGMYIIWGYGPPPDPNSAALRTMTAVARGVKTINHYWYGPYYASTECAFSEDKQYVASVAYVDRILGLADDVLGTAMVPDRKVAILWSQATEQWKPDDAFTVERRMLHYALDMQQIPVDFLCERDVATRLKSYKVLYLPANNLPSDCIPAITSWVKSGGTLVVCGGGPERNEINDPSIKLWYISGLSQVQMRKDALNYRGETSGLAHVKPTTGVILTSGQTIPVAGYKAVLTTDGSRGVKVLGTYKEGGAAVIEKRLGRGKVLTFGFNPGMSLLLAADPASCREFWNVFPKDELTLISGPVFAAGVVPPVSTDVGIDAARLDGPNGYAVTLSNFTLKPIPELKVTIRGVSGVRKVVSCVHGTCAFRKTNDGISVSLPLDTVDVLKLYR